MTSDGCYHCGDEIIGKPIEYADHEFCCTGCKGVYQLLSENNLGNFYEMEKNAGTRPSANSSQKYNYLDVSEIRSKFIEFEEGDTARINLHLPSIHCSSCIYLLENISKIEPSIVNCEVNFTKREASLVFNSKELALSRLALLLDNIGYAPNFGNKEKTEKSASKQALYKLGIAGFAFGSIMLWSFPEYMGIQDDNPEFRSFTSYLSLFISIPVLLYSARDYFISAFKAIRYKSLNLDVPITIGIIALYAKSVHSILIGDGPGYMDSFAGFILFLLIGKWFQSKTYKMMSFERDYTSYFPLAITRVIKGQEEIVEIDKLELENEIILRNDEVLPCDSQLLSDEAHIDYSFVTGESQLVKKQKGDFIYAGGRLDGARVHLLVKKESNRSQLTRLWNELKVEKGSKDAPSYQSKLSVYFLSALLVVAAAASVYWYFIDSSQIVDIVVAILIVACPCALALSAPFTFGNIMRVLGRKGLYLKNAGVIEKMNTVTDIVFDKTGTLTESHSLSIETTGDSISTEETNALYALSSSSTHPLSRAIALFLKPRVTENSEVSNFEETKGKGVSGLFDGQLFRIGSASYCELEVSHSLETISFARFGEKKVSFVFKSHIRPGIELLLKNLPNYRLHLVSGDNEKDAELFAPLFPKNSVLKFNCTPKDKLEYIEELKKSGRKVLMVGDGLNDSGALASAEVGMAISEDIFRFTPSSDAIIDGRKLNLLNQFLRTSAFSKTVITICMVFSITYNIIGLSFAISGNLSPLVAAVLMPLSSITVVFLSTFLVLSKK